MRDLDMSERGGYEGVKSKTCMKVSRSSVTELLGDHAEPVE